MSQALYLLSSLPDIDLNSTEAHYYSTVDEFLEDCEVLGETVSEQVREAVTDPKLSRMFLAQEWANYEYSIRNELAKKRWAQLRSGTYDSILINDETPVTVEAFTLASYIQSESDPLLRETQIILQKWMILNFLDSRYQFTLENIIVYGWKLKLYLTYRSFTVERGKERWDTLLSSLAEKSGFSITSLTGGLNE